MSESFHRLSGSALRASKRLRCSSKLTENQYFSTTIPERTSMRSNSGQLRRNSWCSSGVQNPITHSTFERLDRKSTRLNSSHANISYAVFCLKKKKIHMNTQFFQYHIHYSFLISYHLFLLFKRHLLVSL